jgi:peptidoglycan hydrolase CwlO-like protein
MPAARPLIFKAVLVVALALAVLVVLALVPISDSDGGRTASAADTGALRSTIDASKRRERQLGSAAARLGRLEAQTAKAITLLEGRLAEAQSELDRAQARLADTELRLRKARARHVRLRGRLTEVRAKLGDVLRARYLTGRPDWTDVVLQAQSFGSLMERFEFLHRVQERDAALLGEVGAAKREAIGEQRSYTELLPRRRAAAQAVLERRDSLSQIRSGLDARRAAFAEARSARLAALTATRANRRGAQKRLTRVLAEQERAAARAAVSKVGPGGPWAIPWAIVQCESGGRNVGPNWAGASGYYQFIVATWKGLGGSTPQAYMASKAEQDRLAAKLWDGGRGARNWDCAAIVGLL